MILSIIYFYQVLIFFTKNGIKTNPEIQYKLNDNISLGSQYYGFTRVVTKRGFCWHGLIKKPFLSDLSSTLQSEGRTLTELLGSGSDE